MGWKKVIEAIGYISALFAIANMVSILAQIVRRNSVFAPWDEMASWSVFLAVSCLTIAGRSYIGRSLMMLSALGLLLANGYLSEAMLEPFLRFLNISLSRDNWNNQDFSILLLLLLPFVLSTATLFEAKSRAIECRYFRQATLLGLVWGGLGVWWLSRPFHRYEAYIFTVALALMFGCYLYRLALGQIYMLKTLRHPDSPPGESHPTPPHAL